ncbi:MAG: recombinase family protein [Planctomycetota bacterium]|nr:recombinase family protein [Planctomycetota bacterium]
MKAIGYIRVSTTGQAEDGVSLAAQESKLLAWADLNGYEMSTVYQDAGVSGSKATNRPGLQSAIEDACAEKGALVVYSLSRLARSTRDALNISERLSKAGADLVSLSERIDTTSAAGKMVFRMLAVLAEFERDQISERTSSAMQYLKSQGRYTGGKVRYGFKVGNGGKLLEDKKEQATLARVRQLVEVDGLGLRAAARIINAEGHRSRAGTEFQATQVKQMVAA